MAIDVQEILMRIKVDTSEGINRLGLLEEAYQKLSKAQKETKNKDEKSAIGSEMQDITDKIKAQREQMGIQGLTVKQLRTLQREYAQGWQTTFTEGTEGFKKSRADYDAVTNRLKELTRNQNAYDTQLKETVKTQGIEGLSVKHLQEYYKLLKREIEETSDFESAATKKSIEEAKQVDALIQSRTSEIKGTQGLMEQVFGQLPAALAGGIGGGIVVAGQEALSGLADSFVDKIKKKAEFAKAMGSLAAITGLDLVKDANDLKFYADAARSLGKAFAESSVEIVKTITIVGSLKPELLKQKEALVDITKDIITLSKASGGILSIEDSAKAVTGALNQFDEAASQSTRYINVMAAGAKEGSSEINETAAAFKESGAVLKASNISFEQSNALVQALSSKMIKGGEAGTNLRNIFAKLLTGTDELNPAVVGLDASLEGLSKLSPAEILKKFGQESVVAAMTLVEMKDKVSGLTAAITGTNEATEQYKKQIDNLSGDLDKFGQSWSAMWLNMGSSQDGALRSLIQGVTGTINFISDLFKNTKLVFNPVTIIGVQYDTDKAREEKLKAEAEKRKIENKRLAADDVNYYNQSNEKLAPGKSLDEKKINGAKATAKMLQEQLIQTNKEYVELKKNQDNGEYRSASLRQKQANEKEKIEQALHRQELAQVKFNTAKDEIARIDKGIKSNVELRKKIKEGQDREAAEDAKKKSKLTDGLEEKAERENAQRLKKIQTDTQKEIDIRAKLTYEADLALASEEEKAVIQAEKHAEEQTTNIKRQYQDKNGLVKEYGQLTLREQKILADEETLIENEKNAKIIAIRKEFAQQRELQLKEQITRSLDMYLQARTNELNIQVEKAQSKGDDSRVFVLREQLLMENRQREANLEDAHYLEQKRKLKDNTEAIEVLEQNHAQALLVIKEKYNNDSDRLLAENTQNTIRRYQQDELERLRLQVSAKEQNGGEAMQEKLALLHEEMRLALDVAGTTEQEKANIREHYRQQELGLSQAHNKTLANKIITGFSQAFQTIGQVFSASLNNRTQQEQNSYDKSIQGIDREHNAKVLTDREYAIKKKALDEKHAMEERKLKKEQFELNRAEQLANAAINLAGEIVKVVATPWMIPIISALGLLQIGTILSTEAPAYEDGGRLSTKSNKVFDSGPGFLARVGEKGDEFVVPNWQLRDPVVANLVEFIDTRRVNKVTGFEAGGMTSQKPAGGNTGGNITIQNDNEKLIATLDKLSNKLDTLEAKVMFSHDHAYEIAKLNSQNQQSQKSAFQ